MWEYKELYVGGSWVAPATSRRIEVVSPHSEESLDSAPGATQLDRHHPGRATQIEARRIRHRGPTTRSVRRLKAQPSPVSLRGLVLEQTVQGGQHVLVRHGAEEFGVDPLHLGYPRAAPTLRPRSVTRSRFARVSCGLTSRCTNPFSSRLRRTCEVILVSVPAWVAMAS